MEKRKRNLSIEHKALLTYIEAFRNKLQDPEDVYVRGAEVGVTRVCIAIGTSIEKMQRIRSFYKYHDKRQMSERWSALWASNKKRRFTRS